MRTIKKAIAVLSSVAAAAVVTAGALSAFAFDPVDLKDRADVAVENALSLHAVLFPLDLVVVFRLHHPVAFPDDPFPEGTLRLLRGRWIQKRLKSPVQLFGAAETLS